MTEENRICPLCELSEEDGIILIKYDDYGYDDYYCHACIRHTIEPQYERHERKRYSDCHFRW